MEGAGVHVISWKGKALLRVLDVTKATGFPAASHTPIQKALQPGRKQEASVF